MAMVGNFLRVPRIGFGQGDEIEEMTLRPENWWHDPVYHDADHCMKWPHLANIRIFWSMPVEGAVVLWTSCSFLFVRASFGFPFVAETVVSMFDHLSSLSSTYYWFEYFHENNAETSCQLGRGFSCEHNVFERHHNLYNFFLKARHRIFLVCFPQKYQAITRKLKLLLTKL